MEIKAVAFVCVYNEADILRWTVSHLLREGVDVYISDNWSTDASMAIAMELAATNPERVRVARYPAAAPSKTVELRAICRYTQKLALKFAGNERTWCFHHDADEIRRSKQPGERLIDLISRMDKGGYNAIDAEIHRYAPADYKQGDDPEMAMPVEVLQHMELGTPQLKCWKQPKGICVNLAATFGHCVSFPGKRVAPERLLLKHYPLRSPEQAARKLAERRARWAQSERDLGAHVQYD